MGGCQTRGSKDVRAKCDRLKKKTRTLTTTVVRFPSKMMRRPGSYRRAANSGFFLSSCFISNGYSSIKFQYPSCYPTVTLVVNLGVVSDEQSCTKLRIAAQLVVPGTRTEPSTVNFK
jgi:hypothetical protein